MSIIELEPPADIHPFSHRGFFLIFLFSDIHFDTMIHILADVFTDRTICEYIQCIQEEFP